MSDSTGLLLAISLAERKRDAVVQQLAQSQQNVRSALDQLEQLRSYAGDTDGRWVRNGTVGLSVELLKHHYQFSGRLQQAMVMQDGVIANLRRQAELAQKQLQAAESRLSGLKTVLSKRRAEAERLARRREQADMDEMAAQLFARTRAFNLQGEML
ncbi:MAG: flagellar export protein FliJ [Rhodoferax sp.]|uniref:flagellar export protein FliJ n=1 Tax=Rhodoferax sp. TaxID=50421 RepID=UPI002ACE88A0|nr:flagellar export protein FliJ [Rhodoferax sp.]MDZ7890138.1 flagellar export protein FliJ [Rhodoferax sp.]